MIEVKIANKDEIEEAKSKFSVDVKEREFCFLFLDNGNLQGVSSVEIDNDNAFIKEFKLDMPSDIQLFFLKSMAMRLTDFGIENIHDENKLVMSFFENNGTLDLNLLFKGFCNDVR